MLDLSDTNRVASLSRYISYVKHLKMSVYKSLA